MKFRCVRAWTTVFILLAAATLASGQEVPSNIQLQEQQAADRARAEAARRDANNRFSLLRGMRERQFRGRRVPGLIFSDIEALYREPTKEESKTLQPLDEDLRAYSSLVRSGKAGLVRLAPDAACGDGTRTVSAADECLKYSMPGHGSSYSFRERSYRLRRLSDLHYSNGNFSVAGVLQHGILTGIGDVPLDKVSASSPGLDAVNSFVPVTALTGADKVERQLKAGWNDAGFYYAAEVKAIDNMTYVLRSVAYRGTVERSIGSVTYNELDFDNRFDVTVAFRIVRSHSDGGVTIAWRELSRRVSPKLEPAKKTKSNDRNNFDAFAL